ncbi:hypothetical protein, partial [Streptomyces kanamyceticus]|uniref:hypothetical protein n=1 Tax=Streptomyces kanamyceticus TaxID=1967 RepID=UPI0006E1B233
MRASNRPEKGRRARRGERGGWLFGTAVSLAVLGAVVLFGLADLAWGATLWGDVAPGRPGGGYGFAVTIGLLAPPAVAAIVVPLKGADWRRETVRSLGRAAAALPGTALTCLLLLLCFGATRPKRRRRGPECFAHGEPCWVHEQYPYLWLAGIAAALLCA